MSRRLIVLRHAKAEPHAASDHARELTAGGRRAAADVGRWLASVDAVPDYALVSSATRTRQTWAAVASEFAKDSQPVVSEFSDVLYHAGPEDVVDAIRWVPVESMTVIYVGHNPTAGDLPHLLDDGSGERRLLEEFGYGFPTATAAVFEVDAAWTAFAMGQARLVSAYVGDRS